MVADFRIFVSCQSGSNLENVVAIRNIVFTDTQALPVIDFSVIVLL